MKVILVFALITGTAPVLQFQEFQTLSACQEVAERLAPKPNDYPVKKMVDGVKNVQ